MTEHEWHKRLIEGWFAKVSKVANLISPDELLEDCEVSPYRPRHKRAWHSAVLVFFDSHMPDLSRWLWSERITVEHAIGLLDGHQVKFRIRGNVAATREKRRVKMDIQQDRRVDLNDGHRRSDWGKVKAVRAK